VNVASLQASTALSLIGNLAGSTLYVSATNSSNTGFAGVQAVNDLGHAAIFQIRGSGTAASGFFQPDTVLFYAGATDFTIYADSSKKITFFSTTLVLATNGSSETARFTSTGGFIIGATSPDPGFGGLLVNANLWHPTVANGSVVTSLSGVGPVGSHTTVQEWFPIKNAAGTIRYVPGF
jgi:hypothetical protein